MIALFRPLIFVWCACLIQVSVAFQPVLGDVHTTPKPVDYTVIYDAWKKYVYDVLIAQPDGALGQELIKFKANQQRFLLFPEQLRKNFSDLTLKQVTGFSRLPADKMALNRQHTTMACVPMDAAKLLQMLYQKSVFPLDDTSVYNHPGRYTACLQSYLSFLPSVYDQVVVVLRRALLAQLVYHSCQTFFTTSQAADNRAKNSGMMPAVANKSDPNTMCAAQLPNMIKELQAIFSALYEIKASLALSPHITQQYQKKLKALNALINPTAIKHQYTVLRAAAGTNVSETARNKIYVTAQQATLAMGINIVKEFYNKLLFQLLNSHQAFSNNVLISINDVLNSTSDKETYQVGAQNFLGFLNHANKTVDRMMPSLPLIINDEDHDQVIFNGALMTLDLFKVLLFNRYTAIKKNRQALLPLFQQNVRQYLLGTLGSASLINYSVSNFYDMMTYRLLTFFPSNWRLNPAFKWYDTLKKTQGIALEREKLFTLFEIQMAYQRQNQVLQRILATMSINMLLENATSNAKMTSKIMRDLSNLYYQVATLKGPNLANTMDAARSGNADKVKNKYSDKDSAKGMQSGLKTKMNNNATPPKSSS
jgi:hypothetical protein